MVLLVLLGLVLDNSLVLSRSRQARQVGEEEEEEELAGRPKLSHSCLTVQLNLKKTLLVYLYEYPPLAVILETIFLYFFLLYFYTQLNLHSC